MFGAQPRLLASELTAGYRATREITVKAQLLRAPAVRTPVWDQQAGVQVVWQRRWWWCKPRQRATSHDLEPVTIVFYISGHGFGHASRSIELLNTLAARRPDARLIVRTSVPCVALSGDGAGARRAGTVETDVGVVSDRQPERRRARDRAARGASSTATSIARVDEEAAFLDAARATSRASATSRRSPSRRRRAARVPSVAVGNFTWDWIYGGYEAFGGRSQRSR